jgi:hypothetical protein
MRQPMKVVGTTLALLGMVALTVASSASATTLETKGVPENAAITLKTSLAAGSSLLVTDTAGFTAHTCTTATLEGTTVKDSSGDFTGPVVGGVFSTLSWSNCTQGNPTVHAAGSFSIENIAGTTNGTVRWTGATWTTPSVFGTMDCSTNNTDIGTLNGKKEGTATLTINAVLSCTIIGTAKWSGTYTITSPLNLGVTA